jgi:hypothetical protein
MENVFRELNHKRAKTKLPKISLFGGLGRMLNTPH